MNKKPRETNNKIVQARKEYKCSCCDGTIKIGDNYRRINSKAIGIFHFCSKCDNETDIYNTIFDSYEYQDYLEREVESEARREGIDFDLLLSARRVEANPNYIDYGDEW